MLTHYRTYANEEETDFIHNYYERLVLQEVFNQSNRVQAGDRDFLADVSCVALNRLPPRYIRHDVDMTFFMSPQDMQEVEDKVRHAVSAAIDYVTSRERSEDMILPVAELTAIAETLESEKDDDKQDDDKQKNKKSASKNKNVKKK